ncbi:MAG: hypothetical protein AABY22_20480 [Nanoarchaeota archaeon]
MKNLITTILLFSALSSFAQKSKTIDVARINNIIIKGSISYNEDNSIEDTTYYIMGRDNRYVHLIEFNMLLNDCPLERIYDFLNYSIAFYDEESGTKARYKSNYFSVYRLMGIKVLSIYEEGDGSGYTDTSGMQLKTLLSRVDKWKSKNNIK